MDSVDDTLDSISDTSEKISTEIISDLDSMVTYTDTLSKSNTDASSEFNLNPCSSNISLNAGYPTVAAWYSKFFKIKKQGFPTAMYVLFVTVK